MAHDISKDIWLGPVQEDVADRVQNLNEDGKVVPKTQALDSSNISDFSISNDLILVSTASGQMAIYIQDGDYLGQEIKFVLYSAGTGDARIQPSHASGFLAVTLGDVGDTVTLMWIGNGWAIKGSYGAAIT